MRSALHILGGTLVAAAVLAGDGRAQCRAADSTSAFLVRELTRIATGTDPANQRMREIAKIPQVGANQVAYVTSKTACTKALPVFNASTEPQSTTTGQTITTPSTQLYVVQVGSVYAAADPAKRFGEYTMLVVMSKTYKLLASTGL
jgi:hypothetical protein